MFADVVDHVLAPTEGLVAVGAAVRRVARVRAGVRVEVLAPIERLATQLTLVRLVRALAPRVLLQTTGTGKRLEHSNDTIYTSHF